MSRHRLDIVSLVLGLAAVAMAVTAWTGRLGQLVNHPGAALPLVTALAGVALIASARRRPDPVPPPPAAVTDVAEG